MVVIDVYSTLLEMCTGAHEPKMIILHEPVWAHSFLSDRKSDLSSASPIWKLLKVIFFVCYCNQIHDYSQPNVSRTRPS